MRLIKIFFIIFILIYSKESNAEFYGTHLEPITEVAIAPNAASVAVASNINYNKNFPNSYEAGGLDYPLSRVVYVIHLNKRYSYKEARLVVQFEGDESVISLSWD